MKTLIFEDCTSEKCRLADYHSGVYVYQSNGNLANMNLLGVFTNLDLALKEYNITPDRLIGNKKRYPRDYPETYIINL